MTSLEIAEQRLLKQLQSGAFYEGQQQVLTVYRRLQSRGAIPASLQLLETAVASLLEFKQEVYAQELAQLFLSEASGRVSSDLALKTAQRLLSLFRQHHVPAHTYQKLANAAIKLERVESNDAAECSSSDTCTETGKYILECQGLAGFSTASAYLAQGDVEAFKEAVVQVCRELSAEEGAYLHLHCLLKLLTVPAPHLTKFLPRACQLYQALRETQQESLPISNFGDLLLKAVEKRDNAILKMAEREYRHSLDRDPELAKDIRRMQAQYFEAKRPQMGPQGLFSSLLGSVTG